MLLYIYFVPKFQSTGVFLLAILGRYRCTLLLRSESKHVDKQYINCVRLSDSLQLCKVIGLPTTSLQKLSEVTRPPVQAKLKPVRWGEARQCRSLALHLSNTIAPPWTNVALMRFSSSLQLCAMPRRCVVRMAKPCS